MSSTLRRDPDQLLASIMQDEQQARRGKLKIFFGACAGVGKTWAMLAAARQRQKEGMDVLVGIVETHGRSETALQLQDLPCLPPRRVEYRGHLLAEFDIDAALARAPQLILVDELAHSNVAGSRHGKRWQDVEELLANGIDVYTALNVQHLESLNDVVGSITGIRVRETVPDRVFDLASDVTLVDLPPDELLERLQGGKVYLPEQAARAKEHFFRKGNLIALRELALRRTADRVDSQMRAWRADRAISNVWQARERLIVWITPDSPGDKLVRSAARLAADLKADWIALYIDTPASQYLARAVRQTLLDHLQLAETLGGESVTLASSHPVATLCGYARSRNANKLVLAPAAARPWYRFWQADLTDQLRRRAAELDIVLIGQSGGALAASAGNPGGTAAMAEAPNPAAAPVPARKRRWRSYLWATLACMLAALLAMPLAQVFDLSNVIMIFLATVVAVSMRFGRGPGAWAAAWAVLLFDFFFVPPHLSLTVADVQYLFTFGLMLLVSLGIGQLTARLRFEATVAHLRERRAQALAALSKELSGALLAEQVVEIANRHVAGMFGTEVATLLPDSSDKVQVAATSAHAPVVDLAVAQWVYDHQTQAGRGTGTLAAALAHYLPLKAPMRTRGVLVVGGANQPFFDEPEQKRLQDTFAAQIALALERVHYVEVAQDALVVMEGERLRNSLLSAISHDLRTPLTSLVGLASTLAERNPPEPARQQLAQAIGQEARQMNELVTNLLDMARLQAGGVHLKKDWQSVEEIVGSSCALMQHSLPQHRLDIALATDLPLCQCDPVLIQRVLVNLLDNAIKYSPPGSVIQIRAVADATELCLAVSDQGPGLPSGPTARLFEKFARGEVESNKPGVGLGLALCKIIVQAHGGSIAAETRPEGGARFAVRLPLGELPADARPPDLAELPDQRPNTDSNTHPNNDDGCQNPVD